MIRDVMADRMVEQRQAQWDLIKDFISSYARRQPISTVAVVGNAPMRRNDDRAAAIDACDLVIRANAMMLDPPGSEPCVGTACHAVIMSRATALTPWALRNYRDRAYLVPQAGYVQYQPEDKIGLLLETTFWPSDLGVMPLPNAVVKARAAHALDPAHRPGSIIPTTGLTALFMAHEMWPEATLVATGFSFLDNAEQSHWSHHSGGHTKVNWQHHLHLEQALLRSWIDDGSIRYLP